MFLNYDFLGSGLRLDFACFKKHITSDNVTVTKMIDKNDKATVDIFGLKRLGRPVTGTAKSDKQRMREYRLRKKQKQTASPEIILSAAQFDELIASIAQLTRERDEALRQLQDEKSVIVPIDTD